MVKHLVTVACSLSIGLSAQTAQPKRASPETFKTIVVKRVLTDLSMPGRIRTYDHRFFVLSRADDAIVECSPDFTVQRRIGEIGNGPGELYHPEDFDIARDGTIWVADRGNDRIQGLSLKGEPVGSFPTRSPGGIAALPSGDLAVVGQFDSTVISIRRRDGSDVRTIGEITEIAGATVAQTNYFNRAKVTATAAGDILAGFRFLIPPLARLYGPDGKVKATYTPESENVTTSVASLKERRSEDLKRSGLGGRVSMSGSAVDDAGFVWLAPSAIGIFRFTQDGRQIQEYRFVGEDGQEYGIHDLAFDGDRVMAISGPFVIAGKVPR